METDGETYRQTSSAIDGLTGRQRGRQREEETDRKGDRETD